MRYVFIFTSIVFGLLLFSGCSDNEDEVEIEDWTVVNSGTGSYFLEVKFYNENMGIIVGSDKTVLKSLDGGTNWSPLNVAFNDSIEKIYPAVERIFIKNESEFYVSSRGLYKTENGGQTFKEIPAENTINWAISGIHFFNNSEGIIVKNDYVYKTIDQGETWVLKSEDVRFTRNIQFVSQKIGYAFGGITNTGFAGGIFTSGYVSKTKDAGETWESINVSDTAEIYSMYFLDENIGYISNIYNDLFRTLDAGESWEKIIDGSMYIKDLVFLNEHIGYAIGYNIIYKTFNGGITWEIDQDEISSELFDIEIISGNKLIVIGRNGLILTKELKL